MNEPNKFLNPYDTCPRTRLHRTTLLIDSDDHAHLFTCRRRSGTLQTTLNILLNKLVTILKQNGITEYDPERYEHAVANLTIELGRTNGSGVRGTVAESSAKAVNLHDRCGTLGVAQQVERPQEQSPDAPSAPSQSNPKEVKGTKRVGGGKAKKK